MRSAITIGLLLTSVTITSAVAQPNQTVITLERICYNLCQPYLLQIHSSGTVSFQSGPRSNRRPEQTSAIAPEQFQELVKEFTNIHFLELNDHYEQLQTDWPHMYIGLEVPGKEKTVGHFDVAPPSLTELERTIARTANIHQWLHNDPRRFTLQSPVSGDHMGGGEDLKNEMFVRQDSYDGIKPGITALMQAAGMDNATALQQALQRKEDVNAADETGWTALMIAAVTSRPQAVDAILAAGARVDQRDQHGDTALIGAASVRFASRETAAEIVTTLLAHGASPDPTNDLGESALMWAARAGNPDAIKSLLKAGAKPLRKDQAGHDALFYLDSAQSGLTFDPSQVELYDKARSALQQP